MLPGKQCQTGLTTANIDSPTSRLFEILAHERCNATPCATPSSESGETRHQRKKLFTQGKGTCTKNSKPACLTSGRQRRIIFQCVFKGARFPTPPHATPLTAQVGSSAWLRCNRCQWAAGCSCISSIRSSTASGILTRDVNYCLVVHSGLWALCVGESERERESILCLVQLVHSYIG